MIMLFLTINTLRPAKFNIIETALDNGMLKVSKSFQDHDVYCSNNNSTLFGTLNHK